MWSKPHIGKQPDGCYTVAFKRGARPCWIGRSKKSAMEKARRIWNLYREYAS
jgi:hypothetical protein